MPVTIDDVAREAGVSHTTVSRALNNKGELSPETRARILAVAERLNYVPSSVAQALASGASKTLGLIITNSASPVYAAIVHDRGRGPCGRLWTALVQLNRRSRTGAALPGHVAVEAGRWADPGAGPDGPPRIAFLQRAGIPFVLLLRYFPDLCTDYVVVDNLEAGCLMTDHLLRAVTAASGTWPGRHTCPVRWTPGRLPPGP